MASQSVSHHFTPALLAVGIVLAATNGYVMPARAAAWTAAAAMLIVCSIAWTWASRVHRRLPPEHPKRHAANTISSAVTFTGVIMVISLGAKLAERLGALDDPDFAQRATMVIVGIYFASIGNAMPKMLTPLATLQCDGARVQAFQRFTGWTWVLTGLAFSLAWLTLPVQVASPVAKLLLISGMLVVVTQIVRLRWTRAPQG